MAENQGDQNGDFSTTHWTNILLVRNNSSPAAEAALEQICKRYRYPLYVHARRLGNSPEDAEDSTHTFLIRFIQLKFLEDANPGRGRFRSYLLTSFKRFLIDEWRKKPLERSDRKISWDGVNPEQLYQLEPVNSLTPDQIYEKRWATALLETVLRQLEADYTTPSEKQRFNLLKQFLWGDSVTTTYEEIAEKLDTSVGAVKTAVSRLRTIYRARLRAEIQRTLATPHASAEEVDDELRYLREVLSR